MANSTAMITDMTTVYNNGPTAATTALAIAPSGAIIDYPGMTLSVITDLSDLKTKLGLVLNDTDVTSDATNLALIQKVYNNLS